MRHIFCMLCVVCVMVTSASAQTISRIEYFFNDDPGFGLATALTGYTASADVASFQASINLGSAPLGINNLYIRARDNNGKWSITNAIPFVKVDISIPDVVRAEYFINTDPGFGKATPFTLPVSANISQQAITLDIASASLGVNSVYIRTKDTRGNWSLTNYFAFVKGMAESDISSLEYYIDTDPGFGMATPVTLVPGQNISNYIFNADVSSITDYTTHNLFIRAKDAGGVWSLTNILSFTKMPGVGIDELTDASAEYTAFPNPASDKITLHCLPTKKMDKIELMDTQGKFVQVQITGSSSEKQIDISKLTSGIYFIRITSGKDVVYKKVEKE